MTSRRLAHAFFKELRTAKNPAALIKKFFGWLRDHELGHQIPLLTQQLLVMLRREEESQTLRIKLSHLETSGAITAIKDYLKVPKEVLVTVSVSPELVGGFVAEHNYTIYNGSVKKYLENLKTAIQQ